MHDEMDLERDPSLGDRTAGPELDRPPSASYGHSVIARHAARVAMASSPQLVSLLEGAVGAAGDEASLDLAIHLIRADEHLMAKAVTLFDGGTPKFRAALAAEITRDLRGQLRQRQTEAPGADVG